MELGTNIKKCRIEKRLTQEQLAYELGVSPQAISRWENDVTYPDISMLPTIADYFEVSLDELMGRCKDCNRDEREQFFKDAKVCCDNEGIDEAIRMHRKMSEKYPADVYIQFSISNLLYIQYKASHDTEVEKEIFSLCNKVQRSNKPDMQCGARRLLVLMYVLNQDYEKAEELVNGLPSFLCGREFMIAEVLRGDKKLQSYHSIIKMLETKIDVYQKRIEKIQL